MSTRLQMDLARGALARGGVIAYPTEGVWGLGCDPLNQHAVARLLALKRRPPGKGLILVAATFEQLAPFLARLPTATLRPVLRSWPGPVTWLLPVAPGVPPVLTGGRRTLAVRVTAHPVAAALCHAYGAAIVSTSANITGHAPARNALQVRRQFGDSLDAILPGQTGGLSRPTTIRDLGSGRLLRA